VLARCVAGGERYWRLAHDVQATARSVNTIFAQVALHAGLSRVVNVARRMGIESPLAPVCSLTLGPVGVSPFEMTSAFATLAARGVHHRPQLLERVTAEPARRRLLGLSPTGRRALSRRVADRVTYALAGALRNGTGVAAYFGRPAAGKTGTAESFRDAWFCGYVPQLAACVWIGHARAEIPMADVAGFAQVVGGSVPARVWHDFMAPAVERWPIRALPMPAPELLNRSSDSAR
jgi:penicillin-binding protein 1A